MKQSRGIKIAIAFLPFFVLIQPVIASAQKVILFSWDGVQKNHLFEMLAKWRTSSNKSNVISRAVPAEQSSLEQFWSYLASRAHLMTSMEKSLYSKEKCK